MKYKWYQPSFKIIDFLQSNLNKLHTNLMQKNTPKEVLFLLLIRSQKSDISLKFKRLQLNFIINTKQNLKDFFKQMKHTYILPVI